MLLQALISGALAGPSCETLDSATFRAAVVDAQAAVFRDDLEGAAAETKRVQDDIGCMNFAPEPRRWADLMMVIAVVEYASGNDWQAPLAAALRVWPNIDRLVGLAHPIYDWSPPRPQELQPVLSKNLVYIDGRQVQAAPPNDGWYLVQKTDGRVWNTTWKRDGPVSSAWLLAPVERPPRLGWQVEIAATGGNFLIYQHREGRGTESPKLRSVFDLNPPVGSEGVSAYGCYFIGCGGFVGPELGVRATFFSRFGVSAYGTIAFGLRPGARSLRLTAIYAGSVFRIGIGYGVFDLPIRRFELPFEHTNSGYQAIERSDTEVDDLLASVSHLVDPRPFGIVELHWTGDDLFGMHVVYGISRLNAHMGELGAKFKLRKVARLLDGRPFIGVFGRGGFGVLRQPTHPANELSLYRLETGLRIGMLFGELP